MRFNLFDNMMKSYTQSDEYKTITDLVEELQEKNKILEEKYQSLLLDVKHLEEENIENSNLIYQLMNSIDAVDRRIDIIADEFRIAKDV